MTAFARYMYVHRRFRVSNWIRRFAAAIFLWCGVLSGSLKGQLAPLMGSDAGGPSFVHGTVLNRVTHEPISRALVYSPDKQYATLTDDRGHFEFKFPQDAEANQQIASSPAGGGIEAGRLTSMQNSRPTVLFARKPGFLASENQPSNLYLAPSQSEVTLYLVPESLIVGHVSMPGSEGEARIRLEIYRREMSGGKERWDQAGTFTTWADGEFRFWNLSAGTYKLVTTEQLDRDPFLFAPGGQLFGYPPMFYPSANDFSSATPLLLTAGATVQVNISVSRRAYYAVKFPVANTIATQPVNIQIYPLGHPGPGYSLGYNPVEKEIQGMLPDGNYTLKAEMLGPSSSSGILNFSVHGTTLEGATLNLIPNSSLTVKIKEEFRSEHSNIQEERAESAEETSKTGPARQVSVQVVLTPIEEFGSGGADVSEPVEGGREGELVIHNVKSGRYRVRVVPAMGYAASVQCGGIDLLHEPLVLGMGGSNTPIEITLRDDGAEVSGTVEIAANSDRKTEQNVDDRRQYFVYLLPLGGGETQMSVLVGGQQGAVISQQLRPGAYRAVAFDRQQQELDFADEETLRKFESKGQIVEVTANQKEQIRLTVIREDDAQ